MYFRIAETIGMPVCEMLRRVPSTEITEWLIFFKMQQEEMERPQKHHTMMDDLKRNYRERC